MKRRTADDRRRLQQKVERFIKYIYDERLHHRAAANRRERRGKINMSTFCPQHNLPCCRSARMTRVDQTKKPPSRPELLE